MHPYSIDSEERRYVLLVLAGGSIFLSWVCTAVLNNYQVSLPWWVESPSVMFFFGVLYTVFDRWVWISLKKMDFSSIADIRGEWRGYIKSSFDDHSSQTPATLRVHQTWTRMSAILSTDHSSSKSESGSMIATTPDGKHLSYEYLNEPKPGAESTMSIHRGTARLSLSKDENVLAGEYYSGRDRQNFGTMYFERVGLEAKK